MILLCCSLMLAMLAGGGQGAAAVAHPRRAPTQRDEGWVYGVNFDQPSVILNGYGTVNFTTSGTSGTGSGPSGTVTNLNLILCQLDGDPYVQVSPNNTWKVLNVQQNICITTGDRNKNCVNSLVKLQAGDSKSIPVWLDQASTSITPMGGTANLQNLFFCIGPGSGSQDVCNFYSTPFSFGSDGNPVFSVSTAAFIPPSTLIVSNVQATPVLSTPGATTSSADPTFAPTGSVSVSLTTATVPYTSSTASSSATLVATSSHITSSGLSTGAKVVIALGALALFALLLLAALFFLRKKHSKRTRSQPEQVMLTRDMHTDSFSRNLMMMEKDRGINHTSTINSLQHDPALDTPVETSPSTSLPIQRHSALSPYEPVPSTPYNGPVGAGAAAGASSVPRRKPTAAATTLSTVSRGLSTTSNSTGPISPHSLTTVQTNTNSESRETHTPPESFEAYHDVPIYGDARHVPQVFTSSEPGQRGIVGGGSTSPFLGEETEGMSAEEVARLEEEERRIDAAIAAAEASEASGRGR